MGDGADSNALCWSGPELLYHERRVRWLYRLAHACDKYHILLDADKTVSCRQSYREAWHLHTKAHWDHKADATRIGYIPGKSYRSHAVTHHALFA